MIEDEPKLFDGSDLNQSVLNKMSQDKFQLILGIPEVMRAKNTANKRDQSLINLDSLQFSLVDATIPAQSVKMKSLGFGGQKMPVTSYARDGQPEVTVNFTVDNNFANYKYLWEWLDNLNHCKESIPTKDYYKIAGNPEFAMKMNGGPDEDNKLLRNIDMRIFFRHLQRGFQTFVDTRADIARVMDQLDLRAVVLDQLTAFLTDGIGHDDDRLVALYRAHQRQSDALIARRWLDDDAVIFEQSLLLRVIDHIQRGARFDRTADIQRLKLDQHLGAAGLRHTIQSDQRGLSHRLQHISVNHAITFHFPDSVESSIVNLIYYI